MAAKKDTTKPSSGFDKIWRAAAVVGLAALYKMFWENRKEKARTEMRKRY